MKKIIRKQFCSFFAGFAICLLSLAFSGCQKYKEGPLVSLRSRTDRLANFWILDEYRENGKNKTDSFKTKVSDFVWRFGKDNSFDFYGKVNGVAWSRSGEWHWIHSKQSIQLLNQASDSTYEYTITKLMRQHLWFTQEDTTKSITREWRLKEKTK